MQRTALDRQIEERTRTLGHEMFDRMEGAQPGPLQFAWWQERMLQLLMQDEWFKVQAFRFIDILPMMHDNVELARHLREYFVLPQPATNGGSSRGRHIDTGHPAIRHAGHAPAIDGWLDGNGHAPAAHAPPRDAEKELRALEPQPAMRNLVQFVSWLLNFRRLDSLPARSLAQIARQSASMMAGTFIAGSNIDEAVRVIRRMRSQKLAFTIDVLGEAAVSSSEAEAYHATYLELIRELPQRAATWSPAPMCDEGDGVAVPRVNVSTKLTSLYPGFDPIAWEPCKERAKDILRPMLREAMSRGAHLHVDMEHYAIKDLTLDVCEELFIEPEFRDYPHVGIVLQAYLKDGDRDIARTIEYAKRRGTPMWVRLVKGAYWDSETVWAAQRHWPVPVWLHKWQSDACYERMTRAILSNWQHTRGAFASHNVRSLCHAIATREALDVPRHAFELQMLYGMGDPIKQAAVEMGQRCRIYTPYGNMLSGMAYLIRRLLENTANESFLRQSGSDSADVELLLDNPVATGRRTLAIDASDAELQSAFESFVLSGEGPFNPEKPAVVRYEFEEPVMEPFENAATSDFAALDCRRKMQAALRALREQLPLPTPLLVSDEIVRTPTERMNTNPAQPSEAIAAVSVASVEQAGEAVAAAKTALPRWRALPATERAALLDEIATLMEERRFDLAAVQVLEVAKTWREADADVSEAIDYCRYYAREMRRISDHRRRRDIDGETNEHFYTARGVTVVISPYNFPLSLMVNMTAAALVTGNTVVLKPAEVAAATAWTWVELAHEAGLPAGVLNFAPGPGETVGEALVTHPDVATIAFTGSRRVGLRINALAAQAASARPAVKKVVLEMGAKNAVIVDADADLDEAIKGILASALSYAGQKCSACSRVILLDAAHDRFMDRFVEAARSKGVGPAEEPTTSIPPIADKRHYDAICELIAAGKCEARCVLAVDTSEINRATGGYYVGPHIFDDVPENARIVREETLGPVICVQRARDFEHAVQLFNNSDYALTGGLYSRSPANIEFARAHCECGNLYINRPITGSRVDLQPFGGGKLSGTGVKSGGPDYLLQFCEARTITENTLRRGFAPSEEVMEALA